MATQTFVTQHSGSSTTTTTTSTSALPELSYEDAIKTINPDKGLAFQVWKLGNHYDTWVHRPLMAKSYRLFDSPLLESLTLTPWYIVPLVWLPIVALFGHLAMHCGGATTAATSVDGSNFYSNNNNNDDFMHAQGCWAVETSQHIVSSGQLAVLMVCGVMIWTLIEYSLHRFVFHYPATTPASITFHFIIHGQHHKYPNDSMRLVFPPVPAAIIASLLYGILLSIFPLHIARGLMSGGLLGYVCYDLIHFYIHHATPSLTYFAELKQLHMKHHYREPSQVFGISNTFWDSAFGTQYTGKLV